MNQITKTVKVPKEQTVLDFLISLELDPRLYFVTDAATRVMLRQTSQLRQLQQVIIMPKIAGG